MPNPYLGIDIIFHDSYKVGSYFNTHWHENMQFYYFIQGTAIVTCSKNTYTASTGNLIVVNNNELHSVESLSNNLQFYTIRIDSSLLFSNQMDSCQMNFLLPLSQNRIMFKNIIENDFTVLNYIDIIVKEYFTKELGYELAIKSSVYQLIVILLRKYINKYLSKKEIALNNESLERFEIIFKYIDKNYTTHISTSDLAKLIHVSTSHFCRMFKKMTGKTPTSYINRLRIEKAISYLENSNMNITEIALKCGFDSINYFSRLFKKQYGVSPSRYSTINFVD